MEETEVLVAGAGPAGIAAAIDLARAGRHVLVADKARFPRDKCCGDGLTTLALRQLEELGLHPEAVATWQVVDHCVVTSPSGRTVTVPLPRDRGQFAVTAARWDLDAAFVDVARSAGVKVADGHGVESVSERDDHLVVGVGGIGPVACRYVVAADGMWSPVRKMVGATHPEGYRGEWHAFRQYASGVTGSAATAMHIWFEADLVPGYLWSFPLPGGRANVGFGVHRGGRVAVQEMAGLWPELLQRAHVREALGPAAALEGRHTAWPIPARIDRVSLSGASGRVLFVGDAAAVVDPMTGEGIGQALLSGRVAARAMLDAGPRRAEMAGRFHEERLRQELVADHRMSQLLIRALRHRKGARAAVRITGISGWTRRNFARWLFEDEPRAVLATPRRWHRRFLARDGAYRPEVAA